MIMAALDEITLSIEDPGEILRNVEIIRCELRNESGPPVVYQDPTPSINRAIEMVLEICEDPMWLDGDKIAEKIKDLL